MTDSTFSQSAWDKIFTADPEVSFSPEEQERAIQELAQAVQALEQMKDSPAHMRLKRLIAVRMEAAS